MPRYDILSQESMATLHAGWRRIVSEIGIEEVQERIMARIDDELAKAGK